MYTNPQHVCARDAARNARILHEMKEVFSEGKGEDGGSLYKYIRVSLPNETEIGTWTVTFDLGQMQVKGKLKFPNDYPMSPVDFKITENVHLVKHPNVFPSGYICLDALRRYYQGAYQGWTPAYRMTSLLNSIGAFLFFDAKIDQDYGRAIDRNKYLGPAAEQQHPDITQDDYLKDSQKNRCTDDISMQHIIQLINTAMNVNQVEELMDQLDYAQLTKIAHLDSQEGYAGQRARDLLDMHSGKQCFFTKNSAKNATLCIGTHVVRHAPQIKDGKKQQDIKSVSPSMTYVSFDAFMHGLVSMDIWNDKPITHVLPIILNEHHQKKAEDVMPKAMSMLMNRKEADEKSTPMDVLQVVSHAMTTLTVEMMTNAANKQTKTTNLSARHMSEVSMETFLHLHHLLVAYAAKHPEIADTAQNVVLYFVRNPYMRSKRYVPNLGILFVYILLVPKDVVPWEQLGPALLRETLARNVRFAAQKQPDFVTKLDDTPSERCESHFAHSDIGLKILAMQAWFANSDAIGRPRSAQTRQEDFAATLARYNTHGGQVEGGTMERFYRHFREVKAVSKWTQFLSAVRMGILRIPGDPSPLHTFARVLRQAVKDSFDAKYHFLPRNFSPKMMNQTYEKWNPSALPVAVISSSWN